MTSSSIKLKGQKRLNKRIKKIQNAPKVFDATFKKVAFKSISQYAEKTPRDSSDTRKRWKIKRIEDSFYVVYNDKTVGEKKIPLVEILNDGRGEIRPKRAKALYIPLTEKGKAKDNDAEFGVDYVLAKKVKAYKGTKFIDKVNKAMSKLLSSLLIKKLREVHK